MCLRSKKRREVDTGHPALTGQSRQAVRASSGNQCDGPGQHLARPEGKKQIGYKISLQDLTNTSRPGQLVLAARISKCHQCSAAQGPASMVSAASGHWQPEGGSLQCQWQLP